MTMRMTTTTTMRALAPALTLLSLLLLLAGPSVAQWENRIGISADPDDFGDRLVWSPQMPFNVYFVLWAPRTGTGDAVTACTGFELRATISGQRGGLFRLTESLPPDWLNTLDASDPWDASYRATSPFPVPVAGDHVVLLTWQLLVLGNSLNEVWLQPLDAPTVPGRLAFWRPDTAGAVAVGVRASNDYFPSPELSINPIFDRVENQSFGAVKALYR